MSLVGTRPPTVDEWEKSGLVTLIDWPQKGKFW